MISVLTHDMLNIVDVNAILSLNKDGYVHIEPKVKKVSIIDLGMEKKDIIAFSDFNFSVNIFSGKFKINQLLSLNSDAYILWGNKNNQVNIECLINKVKKLIGKKTIIGIGSGKEILKTIIKNMGEDDWKENDEMMKHCKYEIYCVDDDSIEKIGKII
ncbi:hypothetical protein R9X47_16630 [Wukongibacter baidiensis]|uniref:hypothetical protein n=1 Tax=Wukongibacter baidiensis TaxID=1723361 RepID=UPI003D7FE26E